MDSRLRGNDGVAAQASYIVTHNIRDFQNLKFDVVAITPADFLKLLRSKP